MVLEVQTYYFICIFHIRFAILHFIGTLKGPAEQEGVNGPKQRFVDRIICLLLDFNESVEFDTANTIDAPAYCRKLR